jgi:hypothetical protein
MEKRVAKVNISDAGGTAARGSKTCKLTLPNSWLEAMGINKIHRTVDLSFDGDKIVITNKLSCEEFVKRKVQQKHNVKIYNFYDKDLLCSSIFVDFTDETLVIINHIHNPVKTAFGNNINPTWSDLFSFFESRCVPRERDGIREYLETLGLDDYNPLDIIRITSGRVAEDNHLLKEEAAYGNKGCFK